MRRDDFVELSTAVLQPRLPCLGNIKIGGKGPVQRSGNNVEFQRPVKFDHFKITTRARGNDGNYAIDTAVHAALQTNEPRELNIRFLYNEISHNFQSSLTAYQGRTLRCKGNGDVAFDRKLNREIPCTCPLLKQHVGDYPADIVRPTNVVCKPYGVLSVLLEEAQSYGGFHVFRTTSWETISAITAALKMFKAQFGLLSFIPFKLVIYPRTVVYQDGAKEKSSLAYSVSIVLRASMDTAFQIAAAAQEKQAAALQITAGNYTPEVHAEQLRELEQQDEADVGDEFHPQTVDAEVIIEEEVDPVEARIRRALELRGTSAIQINKKLAQYADTISELATQIEEHFPDEWKRAGDELAAAAATDVDVVDDVVGAAAEAEPSEARATEEKLPHASAAAAPKSVTGDLFE